MSQAIKIQKRLRRHHRVRAKISGTAKQPRLCVFRSNQYIYAQLIDDTKGQTLVAASDLEIKNAKRKTQKLALREDGGTRPQHKTLPSVKTEGQNLQKNKEGVLAKKAAAAFVVGQIIAQKALKRGLKQVIFDRGGYQYHGRVKALAEGARKGGLVF